MPNLRVLTARELGFCFGVRDALAQALATPDPHDVTVHGELVHNPAVSALLETHGLQQIGEHERDGQVPKTGTVLITAHGVSERERARLERAGKRLVDTTCPLVRRAHATAQRLQQAGYHVVVIGKREHVEVRGLTEDLASYDVVGSRSEVRNLGRARLGVLTQTTVPPHEAEPIVAALRAANPDAEVRFVDTACEPTKQRLAAVAELVPQVDTMVVVGGRGSNNTRKLVQLAEQLGARTLQVESAAELSPAFFAGCRVVGLTAGTSTLDSTIHEVRTALEALPAAPDLPRCAG